MEGPFNHGVGRSLPIPSSGVNPVYVRDNALIATVPIWIDVPAAAELHSAGCFIPSLRDRSGRCRRRRRACCRQGRRDGWWCHDWRDEWWCHHRRNGWFATTGGMGGGATTGGGMFNGPASNFGTNGSSDWPGNNARPSYYTYQCATPAEGCSFVAPASLRSSSLRAGARCSCSDGLSQGQIK